ncbi:MAG: ABC transporter permease [Blastocatellia bacterium]
MNTVSRKYSVCLIHLVLSLVALVPFFLLGISSIAANWRFPLVLPTELSLRAWSYLSSSASGVLPASGNSVFIASIVTVLSMLISLPASRVLALQRFRGKKAIMFLLILPILAPSFAVASGSHAVLLRYGLTDSLAGVIASHLVPAIPYCMLLLTGSFARLDTDFEDQARSLGASPFAVFRYVTFPAIAPGAAIAALFAFLISWSQYLTTLFVGGGKIQTLPLTLVSFQRSSDDAVTAALTLIFAVPAVVVFLVVARFFRNEK